jgi:hypothetical protein
MTVLKFFLAGGVLLVSTTVAAADSCAASFEDFMMTFEGDPVFQSKHILFPLVYVQASGESNITDDAGYKAIAYPNLAKQKERALMRHDRKDRDGSVTVSLEKSGAATLQYRFIRTEDCYQLVRAENH